MDLVGFPWNSRRRCSGGPACLTRSPAQHADLRVLHLRPDAPELLRVDDVGSSIRFSTGLGWVRELQPHLRLREHLRPADLRQRRLQLLDRDVQHALVRGDPGAADVRRGAGDRACREQEHRGPRVLAGDVLLSRDALAGRHRQHLALDAPPPGRAQRADRLDPGQPDRHGGPVGLRHGRDGHLRHPAPGRVRAGAAVLRRPLARLVGVFRGALRAPVHWANPRASSASPAVAGRARAGGRSLFWAVSTVLPWARAAIVAAGIAAVAMLLSIQFDGVFAFETYRPDQLARDAQHGLAVLLARLRLLLEPYGLLHADPAGGPPGDPEGPVRGRQDGRDARPPAPSGGSRCRSSCRR